MGQALLRKTFGAALCLGAVFSISGAQAVTLDLTPVEPDLATTGASVDYTFTALCFESGATSGTTTGICGTSTGKGNKAVTYDGALDESSSSGVLTVSGSSMTISQNSIFDFIAGGSYSLTANFSGAGVFDPTGSSLTATGTSLDTGFEGGAYQSGTLVTGDLFNFGFGGNGAAGIFEFEFNNVGGDMAAFGSLGGATIPVFDLTPAYGGNWDPLLTNNPAFWQQSFTATSNVDTFVPVPATVWLFGSGLLAMAGVARKTKASPAG